MPRRSRSSGRSGQDAAQAFLREVGRVVRAIPRGRVLTYGEVAALAGRPGAARSIGRALRNLAETGLTLPWHRVLAHGGRIALPGGAGDEQRCLLREENVSFRAGKVDVARHGFRTRQERAGRVRASTNRRQY